MSQPNKPDFGIVIASQINFLLDCLGQNDQLTISSCFRGYTECFKGFNKCLDWMMNVLNEIENVREAILNVPEAIKNVLEVILII